MKHLLVLYPSLLLDKKGTFDKTLFLDDPRFFACNLFPKTGDSAIRLIDDPSLPDEKYILEISSDGVSIRAASDIALQYGLVTLKQLVNQYKEHLPCLTIEDQPANRHRAVQICTGQLNADYRKDWFFLSFRTLPCSKQRTFLSILKWIIPFSIRCGTTSSSTIGFITEKVKFLKSFLPITIFRLSPARLRSAAMCLPVSPRRALPNTRFTPTPKKKAPSACSRPTGSTRLVPMPNCIPFPSPQALP